MAKSNTQGQDIIVKLEADSKWFKHLKPQQKLFVAEYCTNGFDSAAATKAVGAKNANVFLEKDPIQQATKEFVAVILADRAAKLETKILDVLWKRAFYSPFDFVDEQGQPITIDGRPYDPYNFDFKEYRERLGSWSVCIEGIVTSMHPRDPDMKVVTVKLADRDKALKALSVYADLASDDTGGPSSFVVNVNMNDENKKKDFKIVDFSKSQ